MVKSYKRELGDLRMAHMTVSDICLSCMTHLPKGPVAEFLWKSQIETADYSLASRYYSVVVLYKMKRVFVYSPLILKRLAEFDAPDEKARQMENEILKDPEAGDIVPATGGVRKFRLPDEGKGKRGGLRVLFLDLPPVAKTHLLFLLHKSEAADVSADEKKLIRELVLILKRESKP